MRTTLNIDDEVLEAAKELADSRRVSVGEALSELARRGMEPRAYLRKDPLTGLMVICSPGARKITNEDVARAMEEEDLEYIRAMQPVKS